jgi:hypothetical protein
VDCVYLGALEPTIKVFVDAAERAGQKFRFGWVNDLVSERGLVTIGPSLDGAIVSASSRSAYDLLDAAVRQYRTELDAYNAGIRYDTGAFTVWGATDLLLQAMRGIDGEVNAASTLAALRSFKANTAMFGAVDFTKPLGNPLFGRMFITNAFTYRVVNGRVQRIGEPLNLRPLFDTAQ